MKTLLCSDVGQSHDASRIADVTNRMASFSGAFTPSTTLSAVLAQYQNVPYSTVATFLSSMVRGSAVSDSEAAALFGLAPGAVHVPVGLVNQLSMYVNRELIADAVLPVVPVGKKSDKIWAVPVETLQNIPKTEIVGGRARPNEVPYDVNATTQYNCVDYGLVDFIDNQTLDNADAPINPQLLSMQIIKSFIDLSREQRVANVVFNAANYGANATALTGSDRWDQPSSDPIEQLLAWKESVFSNANTLVIGGQVWPKLRTNPNVQKYIFGRASTAGGPTPTQVTLELFAQALELERVVVGRAKYNSARSPSFTSSYLWGKSAALLRIEQNPNPRATSTFGYTYRFGQKSYLVQTIVDNLLGQMGGQYLKMTHSDDEVVIGGGTTGYFADTVIS